MTFGELGEQLRHLREEKKLTLEDVARWIKIPARTLQEFEKGNQSPTLHPVYCRGFISAYAKFLGMDRDKLESILDGLFPPEEDDYEPPVLIVKKRNLANDAGKVVILIFIALLSVGIWYVYTHGWPSFTWLTQLTESVQTKEVESSALEQPRSNQTNQNSTPNTPPVVEAVRSTALNTAEAVDTPAHSVTATPGENPVIATNLSPPVQDNSTMTVGLARASDPHRLVIATSNQDCWTKSSVDNEEHRQVYLKNGQTHILTFQEKLTLRLGNVNGVKLRLDGENYEIPPGQGATRDLIFDFTTDARDSIVQ